MEKAEKREFVAWLNGVFKDSGSVVVAHYTGLTVAQLSDLRSKMRDAGGTVKVAKNRLAKIALQGTDSEGIADLFTGQTLVAYSNDPITAPKIAIEFAKGNDKLVILGGSMGATTLDPEWGKGSCRTSFTRRVARKAGWYDPDTGYTHRSDRQRTGRSACPRFRRLCPEGRSGIRPFSLSQYIEPCKGIPK